MNPRGLRYMEYNFHITQPTNRTTQVVTPFSRTPNLSMTDEIVGYYDIDTGNLTFLGINITHNGGNFSGNETGNSTDVEDSIIMKYGFLHLLMTSIVLGLMILSTIIGNVFVVAAIILERNLQSVANYLVMSLAVADLMVATLVMPISAVQEVTKTWFLGAEVCDMWISFDVLCCTASILHLVAIAIDRYWAVTQVDYIRQRTAKRIIIMIILVWSISICISIPPLFGWKDNQSAPYITSKCIISQDWGYTVFSTAGAFYVPLFFMLIIYWKIFRAARRRIRKKKFGARPPVPSKTVTINHTTTQLAADGATVTMTRVSSSNSDSPEQPSNGSTVAHLNDANRNTKIALDPPSNVQDADNDSIIEADESTVHDNNHVHVNSDKVAFNAKTNSLVVPTIGRLKARDKKKDKAPKTKPEKTRERNREKIEHKRERKAARTLAIITGAFICCWVPFFIIALVDPFYDEEIFPPTAFSIVLWLGYFNSLLNPIIYTIFNPDFRNAFRKILFGKYRTRGGRRR